MRGGGCNLWAVGVPRVEGAGFNPLKCGVVVATRKGTNIMVYNSVSIPSNAGWWLQPYGFSIYNAPTKVSIPSNAGWWLQRIR